MTADPVRAIADAVLYEGHVLWPYRRSALKNAQRWTFGGVFPRAHAAGRGPGDDPWTMQTQCLVEGDAATRLRVDVRFLHVVHRQALDAAGAPVDTVEAGGERHLTWDEAAEREVTLPARTLGELAAGERVPIAIPAGSARERFVRAVAPRPSAAAPAADPASPATAALAPASPPGSAPPALGALHRTWHALAGSVAVGAARVAPGLHRVTVRIENRTPWGGGERAEAQRRAFCSTHTVLRVAGGAFVSMTDPPTGLRPLVHACENQGTWPVLVGVAPARDTLLSSPIILEDHPQIAPESPGDLFDGGEIDQLLILNVLALTDAEKAEARASDPRVRELMERTEQLTPEQLLRLHGTARRV